MICERSTRRRRAGVSATVVACLVVSGCGLGGGGVPVPADPDEARQTLDSALASWRDGVTPEAMKEASPSILIADPKWERGVRLVKAEVKGEGQPSGSERAFTVSLWLVDPKGKESREEVVYRVGTHPIRTVFRSLF